MDMHYSNKDEYRTEKFAALLRAMGFSVAIPSQPCMHRLVIVSDNPPTYVCYQHRETWDEPVQIRMNKIDHVRENNGHLFVEFEGKGIYGLDVYQDFETGSMFRSKRRSFNGVGRNETDDCYLIPFETFTAFEDYMAEHYSTGNDCG